MAAFEFISNSDLISLSTFSCAQRYSSRQTMFFYQESVVRILGSQQKIQFIFQQGKAVPVTRLNQISRSGRGQAGKKEKLLVRRGTSAGSVGTASKH